MFGFLSHLVFRSFWIGLVCLSFSFPNGINFQKLNVTETYLNEAKKNDLTSQIIQLDHLSGLLFFSSLSFVLFSLGLVTTSIVLSAIYRLVPFGAGNLVLLIFVGLVLLFLVDLIGGGILRRNKWIGIAYFPIYKFFNFVSLAFIYRPWLQVLSTNIKKWKISLVILFSIIVSIALTSETASKSMDWNNPLDARKYLPSYDEVLWADGFYENRIKENELIKFACIQSDIISEDYLRIFIPYKARYNSSIKGNDAKSFEKIVSIRVDSSQVKKPNWLFGVHNLSNQKGITCYLPLSGLAVGKHELEIKLDDWNSWPFPLRIPFWKQ